jgi:hypothetical protein
MNLNTVEISLHETALLKAEAENLPAMLTFEAITKCTTAVIDTAEAVQMGQRMTGTKRDEFWQLDCFLVWPISTAIQSCLSMPNRSPNNAHADINVLRVLSHAMKTLIEPEQIASGLLEKVDAQLADAERGGLN